MMVTQKPSAQEKARRFETLAQKQLAEEKQDQGV